MKTTLFTLAILCNVACASAQVLANRQFLSHSLEMSALPVNQLPIFGEKYKASSMPVLLRLKSDTFDEPNFNNVPAAIDFQKLNLLDEYRLQSYLLSGRTDSRDVAGSMVLNHMLSHLFSTRLCFSR